VEGVFTVYMGEQQRPFEYVQDAQNRV